MRRAYRPCTESESEEKEVGGGMSEEGAMGRLELEKQIGEAENIKRTQNW